MSRRNLLIRTLQAVVILAVASSFAHAEGEYNFFKKKAAGGAEPPSYLISESFDAVGYDLVWTESLGTPNEDYTTSPAPLEGTQSLFLDGCGATADQETWTGYTIGAGIKSETYFLVHFTSVPSTGTVERQMATIRNGTGTRATLFLRYVAGTMYMRVQAFGGTAVDTVATMSASTTYHVWFTYIKGGGTDAAATVAFSTNGVRPTSGNNYAISSNGTSTTDGNRLYLGGDNYTSATNCTSAIYDKTRVDDVAISDNPQ